MSRKPLTCHFCGQPVNDLAAIRWEWSDPEHHLLVGLQPVCAPCFGTSVETSEVRFVLKPHAEVRH